ncbi:MAG: 50S ribosomal protein L11 methyltransferase [Alphaproteobacteria bacterium]|nr:50S ribosomal protein L11 methyltransferase [Alphaproteobacteria bacterium]
MSNNSGSCKLVKFQPCSAVSEDLSAFAEEFFEVVSVDYDDSGAEQLVGYMRQTESESAMVEAARQSGIELPPYEIETVSSQDWLTENVIKFAPVEVAEFLVYGIHEKNINVGDKIGVCVYAATAFGSEHQTTKGCLQALSDINKMAGQQHKILDVGTGSGILAIAATKLWPTAEAVAVDIDDESVIVAAQNAEDNQVNARIKTAYSDGYSTDLVVQNAPYDVIFANILARPLIAMAADMARCLRKDGYAIISGFIDDQVDWVVGEHQKHGLRVVKIYEMEQWRAVLLRKE